MRKMTTPRAFRHNVRARRGFTLRQVQGRHGFTLVEMLVYTAIFAVTSVFLLSILSTVTRVQLKQTASNEVNQQLSFVASTIQRLVREASVIQNEVGVPTNTLVLRMSSTSRDRTEIYADSNVVYLQEIPVSGVPGAPVALTSDRVSVAGFTVTKLENTTGGSAIVQVELTLNYNSQNPKAQVARSWRSAIARISAATFDSSLLPNEDALSDVGSMTKRWKNLFLSGDASIPGFLGLGVSVPTAPTRLKTSGNIAFSSSSVGVVLVSPNNTCYRLGVSNAGALTTTTVPCP